MLSRSGADTVDQTPLPLLCRFVHLLLIIFISSTRPSHSNLPCRSPTPPRSLQSLKPLSVLHQSIPRTAQPLICLRLGRMASQDLKQRRKDGLEPDTAADGGGGGGKRAKNMTMAKRGLKSLALAVSIPVSLTLLTVYLVSSPNKYTSSIVKPFWFPSTTAINLASLATSFLMGVSAWLVWAEGGFHTKPNALYLYCLYVVLGLAWYSLLLGAGARRLGLVACLGKTAALVGCNRLFRGVNPFAADLVKPCLAWSVFLTVVNLTMISV